MNHSDPRHIKTAAEATGGSEPAHPAHGRRHHRRLGNGPRHPCAGNAAGDEDREPSRDRQAGDQTRSLETDVSAAALRALADKVYAPGDIAAAISSGSFQTMGMIVAPCSVRTLSEIATGVTSSLVARAADVA